MIRLVAALVVVGVLGFYVAQALAAPGWVSVVAALPVWAAAFLLNDTLQDRTVSTASIDEAIDAMEARRG